MLSIFSEQTTNNLFRTLGLAAVWLALALCPLYSLDIYTEENPPFNYQSDTGISGIATELLLAASSAVGMDIKQEEIQSVPWVRGYRFVGENADTLLFSMARTEAREDQFLWAGPIAALKIVIIGPKNISIDQFSDLKRYNIGTIRNDVAEQILQEQGIPLRNLQRGTSYDGNVKMLINGRIPLITQNIYSWQYLVNQLGGTYSESFEPLWTLGNLELWYAFNPKSSIETVRTLQRGIDIIKESGEYQEILARYLGNGFIRDSVNPFRLDGD